jgi:hypothetical protein
MPSGRHVRARSRSKVACGRKVDAWWIRCR